MTMHALLITGALLAGDGLPRNAKTAYPVADLLVPGQPFPADNHRSNLEKLLKGIEKDFVPYPQGDLVPPERGAPIDPVLGYYAPSQRLIEKLPPKRKSPAAANTRVSG
jgi:hypothetical protein